MESKNPHISYFTKTEVKDRGWTDGSIKGFLGEPDKEKPNPRSRNAPSIKLYAEDRVKRIEQSEPFIEWFEGQRGRREKLSVAAKKKADDKRQTLFDCIEGMVIKVPSFKSRKALYAAAVSHYNDLWGTRGDLDKCASLSDDTVFLNRIALNMLRHEFTDYEIKLADMFGQVGRNEGYGHLRSKVNDAIQRKYPYLVDANEELCSGGQ